MADDPARNPWNPQWIERSDSSSQEPIRTELLLSEFEYSLVTEASLFSSNGIRYVRHPINARDRVQYQIPTIKHGGGHVMVWECFSCSGVVPLVPINGAMDRFKYHAILEKYMLPHAKQKMARNWEFQQDDDPKHISVYVSDFLKWKRVTKSKWPSQSKIFDPIKHLWKHLDRRVRLRKMTNRN